MNRPMISLATVMKGPVLMAGSILSLINTIGINDPINVANPTARKIPTPTAKPTTGVMFEIYALENAIKAPHRVPKMTPLIRPTANSLRRTLRILSS